MRTCLICHHKTCSSFSLTDNCSSKGDEYIYHYCENCNTLQIAADSLPSDMSQYYGDNYYSMNRKVSSNIAKYLLSTIRNYLILHSNLSDLTKLPGFNRRPDLFALTKVNFKKATRLLDVGCGEGKLLQNLADIGYINLTGLDPFINASIYHQKYCIFKESISNHVGQYDVIYFNHSLEHMLNPFSALESAYNLLSPGGFCIVRIPVLDSYCWRVFKEDWIQLDAPRHFFTFSIKSINYMALKLGFSFITYYCDSSSYQFLNPRQDYQIDRKLLTPLKCSYNEFAGNNRNGYISDSCLAAYLNKVLDCDQGVFILRKPLPK